MSSTMSSDLGEGKGSPTALEVDMERQLQGWRENPTWTDQPPVVKVRKSQVFSITMLHFWMKSWAFLITAFHFLDHLIELIALQDIYPEFLRPSDNMHFDSNITLWQVSVPKGSLCNLNVKVNVGLPPDAVYNIVTDPDNRRVFKNIKVHCIFYSTISFGAWSVSPHYVIRYYLSKIIAFVRRF